MVQSQPVFLAKGNSSCMVAAEKTTPFLIDDCDAVIDTIHAADCFLEHLAIKQPYHGASMQSIR